MPCSCTPDQPLRTLEPVRGQDGWYLTADQIWFEPGPAGRRRGSGPRPALLLDRDGVVVVEVNYLSRVEDVALLPGAAELIAWANRAAIPVVVVTNQAGIARGYFGWDQLVAVQQRLRQLLAAQGAVVDLTIACPYHSTGLAPFVHPDHPMRKPNPGMLQAAAAELWLDLAASVMVGDKVSDLEAGYAAGVGTVAHVLTGHGRAERPGAQALERGPLLLDDLAQGFLPLTRRLRPPPACL